MPAGVEVEPEVSGAAIRREKAISGWDGVQLRDFTISRQSWLRMRKLRRTSLKVGKRSSPLLIKYFQ